ncbi:hypothetical protein [Lysinibacillus fusiformis]|uniref:hypothetical protein n=1 Tax=Lysinibacillus fusiformis TaxID=28031 RepID=UPI0015F27B94|nr:MULTISPECIES: hypothetical protein [Lysinibacillus]MED4671040.1 hypothetical protein [Lysinibacillus fusiformis]
MTDRTAKVTDSEGKEMDRARKVADSPAQSRGKRGGNDRTSRETDRTSRETDRTSRETDSEGKETDSAAKVTDNSSEKKWKTPIICAKWGFVLC